MILVALKEVQCWCFKSSPRDCVSSRILLDYQLNPRNTKMPPSLNIALFGFVWLLSNVFWGKFVREEISDEDNLRKSQWHLNWSALILERLRHRLICFCFCCKYLKQGSDPFLRHKLSFPHHANGHKANQPQNAFIGSGKPGCPTLSSGLRRRPWPSSGYGGLQNGIFLKNTTF